MIISDIKSGIALIKEKGILSDIMAKDTAVLHNSTQFKNSLESKGYQF